MHEYTTELIAVGCGDLFSTLFIMTARQLIKQIERAIEESGEHDCDLVVNTKTQITGRIEVIATPLAQGETEMYVVINLLENKLLPNP